MRSTRRWRSARRSPWSSRKARDWAAAGSTCCIGRATARTCSSTRARWRRLRRRATCSWTTRARSSRVFRRGAAPQRSRPGSRASPQRLRISRRTTARLPLADQHRARDPHRARRFSALSQAAQRASSGRVARNGCSTDDRGRSRGSFSSTTQDAAGRSPSCGSPISRRRSRRSRGRAPTGFYRGRAGETARRRRAQARRDLDARGSRRLPRGRARAARDRVSRRAHRDRAAAVIGRRRGSPTCSTSCRATIVDKLDDLTRKSPDHREHAPRAPRPRGVPRRSGLRDDAARDADRRRTTRPASAPRSALDARDAERGRCRARGGRVPARHADHALLDPRRRRQPRRRHASRSTAGSAPGSWCRAPACCSTTRWMTSRPSPAAPNSAELVGADANFDRAAASDRCRA